MLVWPNWLKPLQLSHLGNKSVQRLRDWPQTWSPLCAHGWAHHPYSCHALVVPRVKSMTSIPGGCSWTHNLSVYGSQKAMQCFAESPCSLYRPSSLCLSLNQSWQSFQWAAPRDSQEANMYHWIRDPANELQKLEDTFLNVCVRAFFQRAARVKGRIRYWRQNSRSENDLLGEASKTCSLKPRLEAKLVSESPKCHCCTPSFPSKVRNKHHFVSIVHNKYFASRIQESCKCLIIIWFEDLAFHEIFKGVN